MARARVRPLLADVVRNELRRAILSGEFPFGSKLPNEDMLCDRFGVSRVTIREAVRGLIEDGYVVRRQGSGTFVTRRPNLRNSLDSNFSYTEYLESAGTRAGKQILGARTIVADAETLEALALPAGLRGRGGAPDPDRGPAAGHLLHRPAAVGHRRPGPRPGGVQGFDVPLPGGARPSHRSR